MKDELRSFGIDLSPAFPSRYPLSASLSASCSLERAKDRVLRPQDHRLSGPTLSPFRAKRAKICDVEFGRAERMIKGDMMRARVASIATRDVNERAYKVNKQTGVNKPARSANKQMEISRRNRVACVMTGLGVIR